MEKRQLILYVKNACTEDWNQMHPQQGERHCDKCNKKVTDFTTFSDEALIDYFQQDRSNICGRFTGEQLSRPLLFPLRPSKLHQMKIASALAAGLLLSGGPAITQSLPADQIQTEVIQSFTERNDNSSAKKTIHGRIVDQEGNPLFPATVLIYKG